MSVADPIIRWRMERWERGVIVADMHARDREAYINHYQQQKEQVKVLIEGLSGGRHARDLIFKMWADQAFDRRFYKRGHEKYDEKKKTMRRRAEQLRSMRLSFGLPPVFNYGETVSADRCTNYVSYHDLDAFKAAVPGLHEISYMMTPVRAHRIVDRVMTRRGHFGRWTYHISDRNETKELPIPVKFFFEDAMDVIEFRMLYDGEYEKIGG